MKESGYDSSASGYIADSFEGISREFTDVEVISTSDVNVVAKAKRYGRWWLLKGLQKEVVRQEAYQQRLRKEFEILMQLQHPYIASAFSIEEVDGLGLCIVMEYVDGVTLKEWLEGNTTRKERQRIADELLEAVAYIHSKGIVHRDLKPSNIIVTRNGKDIKLIDFGLADTDSHAVLKQPAGTPQYMSPEQSQTSTADVRNDIYSLGVIFRQMDLGRLYRPIIKRCLLPIGERYQNIAELQSAVDKARSLSKRLTLVLIAFLMVAAIVGLIVLGGRQNRQSALLGSQSKQITRQNAQIDRQQNIIATQQAKIDSQNRQIGTLTTQSAEMADYQSEQKKKELEKKSRMESGIRIADALGVGYDSLEQATADEDLGVQEKSSRGLAAIRSFLRIYASKLTKEELKAVEESLMEKLEDDKIFWKDLDKRKKYKWNR